MQHVRSEERIVLEFQGFKNGVVVLALHAVRMGMGYPETESRLLSNAGKS
jgi:hypothetical protein